MKDHHLEPVPEAAIVDLRSRLAQFREVATADPRHPAGIDRSLLHRLLHRWRVSYDWREHENRISSWRWVETEHTNVPIRAVINEAENQDAPVVLVLHGWPDSVLRFERILPLLGDVTVVMPALPGFPFASPISSETTRDAPARGMSSIEMGDAVAAAMAEFGFVDYVISAGDVGCDVAEAIAARHRSAVRALHLTDISQYHFLEGLPADLDEAERAYVERGHAWQQREGAYMHEQSTRPDTLAVGLGDSPAGLAAWILEKLVDWTDSESELANAFTDDEALTWISAYWFSRSIGTSFAPYAAAAPKDWGRIEVPTVMTVFPKDLVNAPRQFVERFFTVADWIEFAHGGHFAAWEQPQDYVEGIRRAIAASAPRSEGTTEPL